MSRIWVTGSKGQLGTELALQKKALPGSQFLFTDVDDFDLRDKSATENFLKDHRPELIIHCAAYTAVDKAEAEPETAFAINRDIPMHLCSLGEKYAARIIHLSTDYVFDGNAEKPYSEEDKPAPLSAYAAGKYEGELAILKGKNNIIIRTSWLYSAYGVNFVRTMLRLGKEKQEINVVNDQFGSPTWAKDLAGAILSIAERIQEKKGIPGGIYHYSNEGSCSWYEFATEIMHQAQINCKVNPIPTSQYKQAAKRPAYSVMDKTKIKQAIRIEIPDWKVSLQKFLTAYIGLADS
jgi:dTDP-4-dehydrorhamnose reductase